MPEPTPTERVLAHLAAQNGMLDMLDVPPTDEEIDDLMLALANNSNSAFDDRAQAVILIGRLVIAIQEKST